MSFMMLIFKRKVMRVIRAYRPQKGRLNCEKD